MGNVGTVIKADSGVKRQRRDRLRQKGRDEEMFQQRRFTLTWETRGN